MSKPAAKPAQGNTIPSDIEKLSFEAAMKELETIVRALESGTAELDKAITDYQRGNALKQHCLNKLAEARLKVEQIQVQPDGSVKTVPFQAE